jgi:hypothetical protein
LEIADLEAEEIVRIDVDVSPVNTAACSSTNETLSIV